jgi:hypothetical protein
MSCGRNIKASQIALVSRRGYTDTQKENQPIDEIIKVLSK